MKKVELELLALSESNASVHSYAVVLGEKGGRRKLPIIIGSFEAQAIAIELEKMKLENKEEADKAKLNLEAAKLQATLTRRK